MLLPNAAWRCTGPLEESDFGNRRAAVCTRAGGGESSEDLFGKVHSRFLRVSHQNPALASPKTSHTRARKYARSGAETVGIPAEGAALAEGE